MFISPYDTTVGSKLKGVDRVRVALEQAYVGKSLNAQGAPSAPVVELLGGKRELEDIPAFGHPLTFNTVLDGRKVAIDQRPYARVPVNSEYAGSVTDINNAREYDFLSNRAWAQVGWETLKIDEFERISTVPLRVFSDWLAGQITARTNIDGEQRKQVAIITAWYYLCLFTNQLDPSKRMAMVRYIQTGLRYDFPTVSLLTQNLDHIPNMAAYTAALKAANISPRLNVLNPALLFQITSFSWRGASSKEVAGIALEHPPTFLVSLYAADMDKGYQDTILGRLMRDQHRYSRDTDDFTKNMKRLLEACRGVSRY